MPRITLEDLTDRLELADQLLAGRATMLTPQDLPGRYGRVINAVDHLLQAMACPAALAGGWAVWRHGFLGRVTQIEAIRRHLASIHAAYVGGFEALVKRAQEQQES
jgi:hypothetical protein